jgi:ferredoxin-fold anticodon binding domain-containing protein
VIDRWVSWLILIDWGALATFTSGLMAVGAALVVARRQQRIKEQELRLTLLNERRLLIQKFRDLMSRVVFENPQGSSIVRDLDYALNDISLLFDDKTTAQAISIADNALKAVAAWKRSDLFQRAQRTEEAADAFHEYSDALEKVTGELPNVIKLMEAKTRVPEHL